MKKQDVIMTAIRFYDTKEQARRLMLIANTTDNNEFVCFNITKTKPNKDNDKYPGNVLVSKSPENKLDYDSYVKCDVEYIISNDSIFAEIEKTPIRISDSDFERVNARYELLKSQNKITRIFNSVEPQPAEFEKLKAQVMQAAEMYKRDPKLMAELVDFSSKFYNYSFRNTLLIMMQNRAATFVAGYKKWKELGYSVNKCEKEIQIIKPNEVLYFERNGRQENVRNATREELGKIHGGEIKTQKKTYFIVGHVFDISQTNCPATDYPKLYDMGYESAGHAAIYQSIKEFAEKCGFKVLEDSVNSIALKGLFRPADNSITINNKLADSEKLATITHEFAHALMHKTSSQSRDVAEFEAECLSHMIQRRFGLPISDMNKEYLSTYYSKIKDKGIEIENSFKRISKAYNHVTSGFDSELSLKGFDISRERGMNQSKHKIQLSPEKINQNFLLDIE